MAKKLSRRDFLKIAGLTSVSMPLYGCKGQVMKIPNPNISKNSPFGIYSPYGEFAIDQGKFAAQEDISRHLKEIGAKWVQEVSVYKGIAAIPAEINLYSRIGREAGLNPQTINNPTTVENYKMELAQTITNMKDRVKYWEVDTEPDGIGGWGKNPQGYVELLKFTYPVIKSICPDCIVMFGGLSGGQGILDTQGLLFLEKALEAGAAGFFDGIEFKRHHTSSESYSLLKDHFLFIKRILLKNGLDINAIPVFLEAAMYDGDPNDPEPNPLVKELPTQSETEQAIGLVKTYVVGVSLGIDKIFWNLMFERSDYEPGHIKPFPQNPFNHYGLINNPTNNDGLSHKKLAYFTYKKMVEILDGCDWKGIHAIQESEDVWIYKFQKKTQSIYVAWWDFYKNLTYIPGDTKQITLTGLQDNVVRVTQAVPKYASGKEVLDYASGFRNERLAVINGALTLPLGQSPIFIEAGASS